jgi:hypothetical protein
MFWTLAVVDVRQRAEKEDWRGMAPTHPLQHRPAVDAGQHHIEQDQVVVARRRQVQAVESVGGGVDHVALLGEALAEVGGRLGFVLDDKDAHGIPVLNRQHAARRVRLHDGSIATL